MKKIYETFSEIADDFCDGENASHQLSQHSTNICELWQASIREFAKALDLAGIKPPEDEKTYDRFWENVWKALHKWEGGLSRRKPFSKKIGEMTIEEAKQKYRTKLKVGEKLIIPSYGFGEMSEDYYLIVRKKKEQIKEKIN